MTDNQLIEIGKAAVAWRRAEIAFLEVSPMPRRCDPPVAFKDLQVALKDASRTQSELHELIEAAETKK